MSEPWAHPEQGGQQQIPDRVSVADHGPQHAQTPHTEPVAAPVEPVAEPAQDFDTGPQPTQQLPRQDQHHEQVQQPQYAQQPQPQHEQYQQPAQQYQQVPQTQPQYVAPKKKSGVLGLIGLLLVLAGNILLTVAVFMSASSFEISEDFFVDLARSHATAAMFIAIAAGLWLLGSLLCLIAMAVRRGVVAGAIGIVLTILPSWFLALGLMAAATGSTAFLTLFLD